jgi:hypothetical protein
MTCRDRGSRSAQRSRSFADRVLDVQGGHETSICSDLICSLEPVLQDLLSVTPGQVMS